MTMKGDAGQVTAVYRVQIDADAKTITATAEQVAVNGTLMPLDEAKQQWLAGLDFELQYHGSLILLCDKQTVTLQDVKDAIAKWYPRFAMMSDEEVFDEIFRKKASYKDFEKKSVEEKTRIIKEKFLNKIKEFVYSESQIPLDTPLEQALAQAKERGSANITARFENAKKQRTYTYRIDNYNNRLNTEESYVAGTPWYRQPGTYSFWSNSGSGIQNVSISGRVRDDGTYDVSIWIRKKEGSQNGDSFHASGYNGSGDITAKNRGGQQITVTVTEKGSGKVEVACTGAVSFTEELTFRGNSIPLKPF